MSAKSPRVPSYCIHTARNQAYVRLNGEMVYLGAPHSPESREKYDRLIAEWMQAGRVYVKPADKQGISVNEILLAYRRYAGTIYVNPDGTPTPEVARVNRALRPVTDLYGTTPAMHFGPKAMVAVQNRIADTGVKRGTVNHRVNTIRRAFKWAAKEELIPASVYHGLQTVDGLRRGRTKAPESVPVKPVPDYIVSAVVKHLPATLQAMVRLHDLTGMRSGEMVIMRAVDIEAPNDGKAWSYRPHRHKTEHHGHQRVVPLGPKAQEILKPFLTTDLQAYLFSPARARDERNVVKRAKRQSKVQPSQYDRRKAKPKRAPGIRYTTASYRRALTYATTLAIKAGDLPEGTSWHPHQLRHNCATRIRKEHGLDAVRATLGHRTVTQSAEYAELDAELAVNVAAAVG
jgi:integrase